ncbi:hypothetical protein GQ457_18G016550 [Hibiscus cannabinus]
MTFNSSNSPVGSLDLTVGWCSFRDMLFTAAWALHPPLGFIVRGSSRQELPWPKGEERLTFFAWYDAPVNPRSKVIICGLLKKVQKLERSRFAERICWSCVMVLCAMIVWAW